MSGIEVRLIGDRMNIFIKSLDALANFDPVVVGGLAVMCRLGVEHRVTLDVDSTFDRPNDPPTTAVLVAEGVATGSAAAQRVIINGTVVDVIDTFAISDEELPDEPKDRLFVCAHRYAWETGDVVTFVGDSASAAVSVATIDALFAMKAHALRFGSRDRRRRKRASDLQDLLLLSQVTHGPILAHAPWGLREQVHDALTADLRDVESVSAILKVSGDADRESVIITRTALLIERLLERLLPQS